MSDFKVKMHKIRFPLTLRPKLRWGSLQRSPGPLAVFKGPSSKGKEGKRETEKGGMRRGRERKGREEEGGGKKGKKGRGGASSAYFKRVPRTNSALRIKKCAPRISSGIYFFKHKLINK